MPKRGPKPGAWRSGPDPYRHKQYCAYMQQRNQAMFRGEDWQLTFDDWLALWGKDYDQRGRKSDNLCLTRWDLEDSWTVNNCTLMNRADHMRRCGRRSHDEDV